MILIISIFLDLRDKVEEFEEVIEKANEYGIDWKSFGYDFIGIEQEVSEISNSEHEYINGINSNYYASRGVEV